MIVGIMGLTTGYDPVRWHMVLFYLAIVFVVGTIAATRRGSGARYWIGAGIFTLCAWVILVISLLATGVSHRDFKNEKAISTSFFNSSGWSSRGYVYMLGWQYSTIASGADASAHMSEETQNPARNVPKAMTWAIIGTYTLAYISIILLFISVDPQTAAFLATQDFPVGHILEEAVNAQFAVAMCIIAVVCFCLQLQAQLQASSRFVFALARDRALPFSDTIKSTNRSKQPWVAHLICVVLWAACAPTLLAETGVVLSVVTVVAGTLSMLGYVSGTGNPLTPVHPRLPVSPVEKGSPTGGPNDVVAPQVVSPRSRRRRGVLPRGCPCAMPARPPASDRVQHVLVAYRHRRHAHHLVLHVEALRGQALLWPDPRVDKVGDWDGDRPG